MHNFMSPVLRDEEKIIGMNYLNDNVVPFGDNSHELLFLSLKRKSNVLIGGV